MSNYFILRNSNHFTGQDLDLMSGIPLFNVNTTSDNAANSAFQCLLELIIF